MTSPAGTITHIALWEAPAEGPETTWGDHVTDDEYGARTE